MSTLIELGFSIDDQETSWSLCATQMRWQAYQVVATPWGLYPLRWAALRLALKQEEPTNIFANPPHSLTGELDFRQFLTLHAKYLDQVDAGNAMPLQSLLIPSEEIFVESGARIVDDDGRPFWQLTALIHDVVYVLENATTTSNDLSIALDQATALREACRAASDLHAVMRLSFVADLRPADAPILEFTAGVEGFLTIAEARFDRELQIVLVCLCSGYIYRLSVEAIHESDRAASSAMVVNAECVFGGGALRITYSNGIAADWPCDRILRECESRYCTFDYERGGHELISRRNIDRRHERVSPRS